ncbi:MAG: GHKL domain-containing protein [Lachnospiraceae bacterium]|nr:GHKL domain-containing protein [Lachnospiraceae bacterium]
MEEMILSVVANVIRAYAIYRCMEHFLISKKRNDQIKVVAYLLFVVITSGGFFLFNNMAINLVSNIGGLLLITTLYIGSKGKKILMVMLIYIVNIIIESGVLFAFSYSPKTEGRLVSVYECLASMIILLIIAFLSKTIDGKQKDKQFYRGLWIFLIAVPLASIGMVLALLQASMEKNILIVIEVSGLLLINLIIFYLYDALQRFYVQKRDQEILEQQIQFYDNELEIMKNSYYKIRAIRHDMRHHMKELRYLAKENHTSELLSYMENMEQFMNNPDEYVASGNKEIDSTLNYLLQKADELLVKKEIHVVLPENLEIHTFVINVIIGNLLENAIEAAEKSVEKYINVEITTKKGLLYIKMQNSFDNQLEIKNDNLVSSKTDKEKHGIGLVNVKKMVEEQGGIMSFSWNENRFHVEVMLYLSKI